MKRISEEKVKADAEIQRIKAANEKMRDDAIAEYEAKQAAKEKSDAEAAEIKRLA